METWPIRIGVRAVILTSMYGAEMSQLHCVELTVTLSQEFSGRPLWPTLMSSLESEPCVSRVAFRDALMSFLCFDSSYTVHLSFLFFFLVKKKTNPSLTLLNASLLLFLFNRANKMNSNGKFSDGCLLDDYYFWMPLNLCEMGMACYQTNSCSF